MAVLNTTEIDQLTGLLENAFGDWGDINWEIDHTDNSTYSVAVRANTFAKGELDYLFQFREDKIMLEASEDCWYEATQLSIWQSAGLKFFFG